MSEQQVWVYEFSVWPREGDIWPLAVFDTFRFYGSRLAMEFTEANWTIYRDQMDSAHFTLREVTRTPYQEPEVVR